LSLFKRHIVVTLCCLAFATGRAQVLKRLDTMDVNRLHFTRNKFINNIFQQTINSVQRTPDSGPDDSYLNGKAEDPFMPYQGKIIRRIMVEPLNFDRSFSDTNKVDKGIAADVGRTLHRRTREFVIRNNLFIRENTPLNAYKVADNERYLRDLEYIGDARILVLPIQDNPDSVDIKVLTTDLFSIAGGAANNGTRRINANIFETNLAGMAQRVEVSGLYDQNRSPLYGYGGLYRKDNVGHSFIDASVAYNNMAVSSYTKEEETSQTLTLSRQLVSPYSRFAGQLTVSHNQAYNLYHLPDNKYFQYDYNYLDAWAGYNMGITQLTASNNSIRDRRFFAVRYYDRRFLNTPPQIGNHFDPVFNSSRAVLGQMTFFRQDYYRTQYIYGFGTTEDLPYGYNIAVTGGWHQQLNLNRPYLGLNASRYIATGMGDFLQLFWRSGTFMHNGGLQDASFLIGATAYSRIFFLNSTKIRQYVNVSYTHLYDRVTYAPLRIDNDFGIRGFLSDSSYGTRRLTIQTETIFFLKLKILGFQFAPFPYADLTVLTPQNAPVTRSSLYTSLGGGIRVRNEKLVFQTIELRAFFFPVAPTNMKGFKLVPTFNLRFRYTSNYITEPDLVQLNNQ